jgi:hypothetical protein
MLAQSSLVALRSIAVLRHEAAPNVWADLHAPLCPQCLTKVRLHIPDKSAV